MVEPPSGTVTFLFTDIEGSTRHWDEPSMASALERHDAIVAHAIRSHGGYLVKHTGDGAMAAFEKAADALASAVAAQRGLAIEPWVGQPIRARMAIHTGEAEERDGDYFGPTPTLAARLMDVGHGGQVLASRSTEEMVRGRISEGVSLLDLGDHGLKDLDRRQRVFQVTVEGLEEQFPPLRAAKASDNLPRSRTSFVGRTSEIEEVQRRLEDSAVVTLTGVGGSGKTRLAVEAARQRLGDHGDGVYFVDLSPIGEAEQVARAVGDVLGLPSGHQSESLDEVVVGFLSGREALLLLDNCEHVIDAVADLVDRILAGAPGVRVLATSREALDVEGEVTLTVASLDPAGDALVLFADRAVAVQPGFDLDGGHRSAVEEICRRLDGMPLAIELAAARVQHLSPADIAKRLDDRFRLLTGGGRRRAQRQQTLQAVVDWSHDLLDDEEQILFRRLAAFAGGFTLPAVEGVCSQGSLRSTVDVLGSLVSKSLVTVDVQDVVSRYRLLETLRMYAQDKLLAAGEASDVRDGHRDWLVAQVESSPEDPLVLVQIESEFEADADNLWLAVEWSAGEGRWDLVVRLLTASLRAWNRKSRAAGVQECLETAAAADGLDPSLAFRAHAAASVLATFATDYASMGDHADRALELEPHPVAEHASWLASALFSSALATMAIDPEAAERALQRAFDLIREHGLEETESRYRLGLLRVSQQRYAEAAVELDALVEQVGIDAVWVAAEAVIVHHLLGEHDQAAELADRLGDPGELSDPTTAVVSRTSLAIAELSRDRPDRARARLLEALAAARYDGVPRGPERCLVTLAYVEAHHGPADRAALVLGRATKGGVSFRTPADDALYRRAVDELRGALDRDERHRLRAEGSQLTLDQVVSLVNSAP
ncbi:MAG: NB-ARC domain-containing protein [Acidimicrobiales bacterium]